MMTHYGPCPNPDPWVQVVGLRDSYHGDTLGAMDAGAPSAFNGPRQTPWYAGRGLFLAPPTAALVRGRWRVLPPAGDEPGEKLRV